MKPWHFGNTTVRSPFRLRDGLTALSKSPLQGNLRGKEQEIALRALFGQFGIVELGSDETFSVGRKWRSALNKLGFLFPEIPKKSSLTQDETGKADTITPNGWRLIHSESVPAMQECFLRSLAAFYIPSPLETSYSFPPFSPLRHTLLIMKELEKAAGESRLNFIEMAFIVQLSNSSETVDLIVEKILDLRSRRAQAVNKKAFDREEKQKVAELYNYAPQTFFDYADTNFRYLKATGLVRTKGRGIALIPEKQVFIEKLIEEDSIPATESEYLSRLCNGSALPTDNRESALIVMNDLLKQVKDKSLAINIQGKNTETAADIAVVRYELEDLLFRVNEVEYAQRQPKEWFEISVYMQLLANRSQRSAILPDGEEISIPNSEAPAYFEWVLWRAFLAIGHLHNKPYEARRFKIDQDFLPVGTAPGNGPDLIFHFDNYILAVEVTLTDNSRQEAAEGEPVRRHIADLAEANPGKQVIGLFIANRIDSNTAETFRRGVWYRRDDTKLTLDIVPVTLEQFYKIFVYMFEIKKANPGYIKGILDECLKIRYNYETPQWKQEISDIIEKRIRNIIQLELFC